MEEKQVIIWVLEADLEPGDQARREVLEGGTQLLGANKKDTRVSLSISQLFGVGQMVSDSGDPKMAKAEVKAAAGVQPVALKSSRHRAIMHQTMFLSPVQISVHISSFQPPYWAASTGRSSPEYPLLSSPDGRKDGVPAFNSLSRRKCSHSLRSSCVDSEVHSLPLALQSYRISRTCSSSLACLQGADHTEKWHLFDPCFFFPSPSTTTPPPTAPLLIKIPRNKWQQ